VLSFFIQREKTILANNQFKMTDIDR